jgi:hypothetical protein
LVGRPVFIFPVYFGQKCHLFLLSQTRTDVRYARKYPGALLPFL